MCGILPCLVPILAIVLMLLPAPGTLLSKLSPPPATCDRTSEAKLRDIPAYINTAAEFDVVLYGATGFTGKLVAKYLAKHPEIVHGKRSWAIAGRSQKKLEALGLEGVPVIVAGSTDTNAINALVARTRVVISTAGPFNEHGSELVAACARQGVHFADISGEFPWIAKMVDEYSTLAEKSGAKIVNAAGFDSLPFDLATLAAIRGAEQKNNGTIARVTTAVTGADGDISGGTLWTGVDIMRGLYARGLEGLRFFFNGYTHVPASSDCHRDILDVTGWGPYLRYDQDLELWGIPHFMAAANARIVRRSLHLLGYDGVTYAEGMSMGSLTDAIGRKRPESAVPEAPAQPARNATGLMERFALMFKQPGEGPSQEVMDNGFVRITAVAVTSGGAKNQVWFDFKGDPGYKATSMMLAETGLCLADPGCHSGHGGGILTTATASGMPLLHRLHVANSHDLLEMKGFGCPFSLEE